MNIDLRRFFENDDIRQDFDYTFTADDILLPEPIRVYGYIKSSVGVVSVSASAEASVSTQCAKCAKDITQRFSVPINHLLVSQLNDEDNDDFILIENYILSLDDLASEDIFLYLPSRFLCKKDCKGLCSVCGSDLNEGECGCKKPVDPRLAALTALLNDDE